MSTADGWSYDRTSLESIISYAGGLEHHSLREVLDESLVANLDDPHRRRGSFGNAVEQFYFGYDPNSSDAPDFEEVGLELKTTPLKENGRGELVAKERLVIGMIDYHAVVHEHFESSHFLKKASNILLISYLYEKDKNPLDYQIVSVDHWELPEADLPQIKRDWETVVNKIRSGHAEDISGSDTLYLEACTKAANADVRRSQPFSGVMAKPRAWAFKSSYMTAVQHQLANKARKIPRSDDEEPLTLLGLIKKRFEPYFGLTEEELSARLGISRSKNRCARITNRILGLDDGTEAEEFVKAGIKPKTIRLRANGRPKEAMSFPTFDYFELVKTPFEASEFYVQLLQKYLFVLYREDNQGNYKLYDLCFWQMPDADFDEACRCYEQMADNVRAGRADISVRSSENRCCHVRPHGRDALDTKPQPYGPPVVKKCFWLNQGYLQGEILRALEGR